MANPPEAEAVACGSIAIIDAKYCAPDAVDLIIKKDSVFDESFTVKDTKGNVVFRVDSIQGTLFAPTHHRFVRDARGNPVVHLRRSVMDYSWKAYRGQSSESRDMIFSHMRSSPFQARDVLNVFLANNNTAVCDFKVKSALFGESSLVYLGQSDTVLAQITKELGLIFFNTKKFTVRVSPNIDYAFIVALIVTLDHDGH